MFRATAVAGSAQSAYFCCGLLVTRGIFRANNNVYNTDRLLIRTKIYQYTPLEVRLFLCGFGLPKQHISWPLSPRAEPQVGHQPTGSKCPFHMRTVLEFERIMCGFDLLMFSSSLNSHIKDRCTYFKDVIMFPVLAHPTFWV